MLTRRSIPSRKRNKAAYDAGASFDVQKMVGVETINANRAGDLKLQRNGVDKMEVTDVLTTSLQPVELKGDFIYQKGALEAYCQDNATETVIATINTPVPVNLGAAVVSSYAVGLTVTTAGLVTYNGARTRRFHCGCTISAKAVDIKEQLTFAVFKNGILVPGSKVQLFEAKDEAEINSTAIHSMPEMSTGDTLQVYVENNTNAGDVLVTNFNLFVLGLPNTI